MSPCVRLATGCQDLLDDALEPSGTRQADEQMARFGEEVRLRLM